MPKRDNEPKNSAPTKKGRMNTKTRQKRHERNIAKAEERRKANWVPEATAKILKKRETRARQAARTPAQRAEASAAGRQHRKPRFR